MFIKWTGNRDNLFSRLRAVESWYKEVGKYVYVLAVLNGEKIGKEQDWRLENQSQWPR